MFTVQFYYLAPLAQFSEQFVRFSHHLYSYFKLLFQEVLKVADNSHDSDDNFAGADLHDSCESSDPDYDDIPLSARTKKKPKLALASSDVKRKRGRPRKSTLKVPPLRIKAVKSAKSETSADTPANEITNTEYKIHEEFIEVVAKEGKEVLNL